MKDWCRLRVRWSEPLQRKAIVFNINKPLCKDSWRGQASSSYEHDGDAAEAAGRLVEVLSGVFGGAASSSGP